jgi:predicted AlkP superfamily pyrophosphatase or phosphodiesterase
MSNKVILVVVDGLKYETALGHCGFLEGQVESGEARRWRMRASLPSMSAPCYESLHTGLDPAHHGITANSTLRTSNVDNIFTLAQGQGKTTAAVAYSWFSVLYNNDPYDPVRDQETDDPSKPIQFGRFYDDANRTDFHLAIPSDNDLCAQVDRLIGRHAPDYLLFHTLSCDSVGHVFGGSSWQYQRAATVVDSALGKHLPGWRKAGYRVLVTADHGFTDCGYHGGTNDDVRDVAFYDVGHPDPGVSDSVVSQRAVAPTILTLMGLAVPAQMKEKPLG